MVELQRLGARDAVAANRDGPRSCGGPGRRLDLRRVEVHLNSAITAIRVADGRVTAVATGAAERPASAVVSTVDPWHTFETLLPAGTARRTRRRVRSLRPALAPAVRHEAEASPDGVRETSP